MCSFDGLFWVIICVCYDGLFLTLFNRFQCARKIKVDLSRQFGDAAVVEKVELPGSRLGTAGAAPALIMGGGEVWEIASTSVKPGQIAEHCQYQWWQSW